LPPESADAVNLEYHGRRKAIHSFSISHYFLKRMLATVASAGRARPRYRQKVRRRQASFCITPASPA
jgi:hypothetical protein